MPKISMIVESAVLQNQNDCALEKSFEPLIAILKNMRNLAIKTVQKDHVLH